jgi:hypothetical protein
MTGRRKDGPTGRKAIEEIETRLGDLLGRLGETLGDISAAGARDGEGARPVRVQGDVRIRVGGLTDGGAGEPPAPGDPPPAEDTDAPRAPVIETHETAEGWSLTADMPGADPTTLEVIAEEARLAIRAGGVRRFAAELPLPGGLDPATLEHRLANGILEVRLRRAAGEGDVR